MTTLEMNDGMPRMSHCCQKQEGRRERGGKGKKQRYNNNYPDSFVGVIELHAYQAGSAGSSESLNFGMPIACWHCSHPATGACNHLPDLIFKPAASCSQDRCCLLSARKPTQRCGPVKLWHSCQCHQRIKACWGSQVTYTCPASVAPHAQSSLRYLHADWSAMVCSASRWLVTGWSGRGAATAPCP